jgi:hypothetical protein
MSTEQTSSEQQWAAFYKTPLGKAYQAFERGDRVFQCSWDVERREGFTSVGGKVLSTSTDGDPNEFLNAICKMGWELVSGSFVFVPEKQHDRERFLGAGRNTAISGTTMGHYLFRRCEANRDLPWA